MLARGRSTHIIRSLNRLRGELRQKPLFACRQFNSHYQPEGSASLLQHEVFSKYFRVNESQPVKSLSPTVLESMVDEALLTGDIETTTMLIPQTLVLGRPGVRLIEKIIRNYTEQKEFALAISVLEQCDPQKFVLSPSLCNDLALGAVNFFRWHEAFVITLYMIAHDMKFSERIVYFAVSGLMNEPDGLYKILDLLNLIMEKRREDLGNMFNFGKVNKLSSSMGGKRLFKRYQLESGLKKVMETWNREAANGFRSFSVAKMIIAVACAVKMETLASNFILQAMKLVSEKENSGYDLDDKDALSLLRAFSQGDGLVMNWFKNDKIKSIEKEISPVALALAECSLKYCKGAADGSLGIMKCVDFYTNYWVLAYRLRGGSKLLSNESRSISTSALEDVEFGTKQRYEQLINFLREEPKLQWEISCLSSADRRTVRLLCDQLGLKHKVLDSTKGAFGLLVSKQGIINYDVPSFDTIYRADASLAAPELVFDCVPIFWNDISKILFELDETILSIICVKLAATMKRHYQSTTWLLLLGSIFVDRGIPLPSSFLGNAIKMCGVKNDIYGLIEILNLASVEQERSSSSRYQASCRRIAMAQYNSLLPINEIETSAQKSSALQYKVVDHVGINDWNNACYIAYLSRPNFATHRAFQEAFMEVMGLRRKNKIDFDAFSSELLLKFLTQNMVNRDLLKGLLGKFYNSSSSVDAKPLSTIECLACTRLLMAYVNGQQRIQLSFPLFKSDHYLQILPSNLEKVADSFVACWISDDLELSNFQSAWASQHSTSGRKKLFGLVNNTVNAITNGSIEASNMPNSQQSIAEMVIFVSYLSAAYDKNATSAFNLLFSTLNWVCSESNERHDEDISH